MAMRTFILALMLGAALCCAKNMLCGNDKAQIFALKKCYAEDDFRSVHLFMFWPTHPDGSRYASSGTTSWDDRTRFDETKFTTFTENDIVYKVTPQMHYECSYKVIPSDKLAKKFKNSFSLYSLNDAEYYIVFYSNCGYAPGRFADTTFAETKHQRYSYASSSDAFSNVLAAKNMEDIAYPWKFFREDGTLRFQGTEKEGICYDATGMKRTKRVTSPEYCK